VAADPLVHLEQETEERTLASLVRKGQVGRKRRPLTAFCAPLGNWLLGYRTAGGLLLLHRRSKLCSNACQSTALECQPFITLSATDFFTPVAAEGGGASLAGLSAATTLGFFAGDSNCSSSSKVGGFDKNTFCLGE
jgi:hypothetical protein